MVIVPLWLYYDHQNMPLQICCIIHVCSLILQRDILSCAEHLDQLEEDFGTRMTSLKEIVQSKTAVPTSQVYVSV